MLYQMAYRANFVNRYAFGKKNELEILPKLITYFARDITATTNNFDKFDFVCPEYKYELKSRTNKMNAYSTTMVGLNKMETNAILLFRFTDCLTYINYNKDKFSTYKVDYFTKYDVPQAHIYIPISDLKVIEKY